MIARLKEMFQEQACIERFTTINALLSCKMVAGISVSPHVLKMKGYLYHLEKLCNTHFFYNNLTVVLIQK